MKTRFLLCMGAALLLSACVSSCSNDNEDELEVNAQELNAKMELSASDFEGLTWSEVRISPTFSSETCDQCPANAEEFSKIYLAFDEDNELVLHHKSNEDYERQWGERNETYNQYYKGVRVNGSVYYLHYENGILTAANGSCYIIKDFNFQKKISKEQAKNIFAEFWGLSPSQVVEKELKSWDSSTNIEYCIAMLPKQGKPTPYLVYYITLDDFHISDSGTGIYGYVNAQTGKMVYAGEKGMMELY